MDQRSFGYYRYVKRLTFVAAAAVSILLLWGCKKDIQNQDAVRQGVMTYLSKRSDLLAMEVSVTSVNFNQDQATAQVHFQAKGNSSPGAGMTMEYVLDRKDGQWVVRGKAGANAAHGANGPAVNPTPGRWRRDRPVPWTACLQFQGLDPEAGAGSLPPGHPSVPGGSQALPPGHPPVNPNQQK